MVTLSQLKVSDGASSIFMPTKYSNQAETLKCSILFPEYLRLQLVMLIITHVYLCLSGNKPQWCCCVFVFGQSNWFLFLPSYYLYLTYLYNWSARLHGCFTNICCSNVCYCLKVLISILLPRVWTVQSTVVKLPSVWISRVLYIYMCLFCQGILFQFCKTWFGKKKKSYSRIVTCRLEIGSWVASSVWLFHKEAQLMRVHPFMALDVYYNLCFVFVWCDEMS